MFTMVKYFRCGILSACGLILALSVTGSVSRPGARALTERAANALLWSRGKAARARSAPAVVIDPGHPSERNDGKRVVNGISEVRACWLVAVRLRELLEAVGVRVTMTKEREGQFVSNRDRAMCANRSGANLFLRLHCDSGTGSGFAVYYPDRKGKALGRTGPEPSVIGASHEAALRFHRAVGLALSGVMKDNGVRGDSRTFVGRQQGALTGSVFSRVPVLTVEMCVLDHPGDAAFIRSQPGREQMAKALLAGVQKCLGR